MSAAERIDPVRFRSWIARRLGLQFDDAKLGFLAGVLARRVREAGGDGPRYLETLEAAWPAAEMSRLVGELTVAETYFFRHLEQLKAFEEVALPAAEQRPRAAPGVRVLSAGCASGEEPYSLAMCIQERGGPAAQGASVLAVDVNPEVLEKARRGRYSAWSLREAPPDAYHRWLHPVGREYQIDPVIHRAVTFEAANLAEVGAHVWGAGPFDVVFCRNVLMYFTHEAAKAVIDRLTRALVPGGHLFLGHAETMRGLSSAYHLCHTHGTFYYRRKTDVEIAEGESAEAVMAAARMELAGWVGPGALESSGLGTGSGSEGGVGVAAAAGWSETWVETIRATSERIRNLAERGGKGAGADLRVVGGGAKKQERAGAVSGATGAVEAREPVAGASGAAAAAHVESALELLRGDRYADALTALGRVPADAAAADADILLLRAALLTHSGDIAAAESAARTLLARDELSAGAHYLLALCRESAGDSSTAVDHDESAAYLDPSFAMPRLHLGLMASRAGDIEGARRELARALPLLQREEASRLLLFGGGFGREALVALCRSRLQAEGEAT